MLNGWENLHYELGIERVNESDYTLDLTFDLTTIDPNTKKETKGRNIERGRGKGEGEPSELELKLPKPTVLHATTQPTVTLPDGSSLKTT